MVLQDALTVVLVLTVGQVANLEKRHGSTKICLDKRAKQNSAALKQKNGSILALCKKPTTVHSTVSDPPPVLNAMWCDTIHPVD